MERKTFPRALAAWALDSGGFTELSMYGAWQTKPQAYARAVRRYQDEIGRMAWCAPQDWMCEPFMLARTGLAIREHQRRTIESVQYLRSENLPVIPVLQGWHLHDYQAHAEAYADAGIDLTSEPLVGLGSVCRRQHTDAIALIAWNLHDEGIRLHGFGVKTRGLANYHDALASSDSLAWSYNARRNPPLPGCTAHKNCANCIHYATAWRSDLLDRVTPTQLRIAV